MPPAILTDAFNITFVVFIFYVHTRTKDLLNNKRINNYTLGNGVVGVGV